jgi:hypothetical protein
LDNFYEQLVAKQKSSAYKIVNAAFYIFAGLALLTLSAIPIFVVCLLLAVAAFFGKKALYVEFEYAFTNGDIDIDRIVEAKKRKRLLTFDVKNAELIAPEDSSYVKDFSNKPSKMVTLFPGGTDRNVYVAMVTGGNERFQLRFTPDEEFLNLCYKYNPRAVKKS